MPRILVVEDDPDIQTLLVNFLQAEAYTVAAASDGVEAVSLFHQQPFNLILLDIMLPKIDGYGVLELIRRESGVPVVLVTALDAEENQLKGFDLLADDYVTKPFSMPVLLRKVAAVLRRTASASDHPSGSGSLLRHRDLALNVEGYQAYQSGDALDLTQKEFELLKELIANRGRVLTRQALLNRVWGYDFFGDERVVDTHVKNLRKKLGVDYIETIRGVGYRVDPEN